MVHRFTGTIQPNHRPNRIMLVRVVPMTYPDALGTEEAYAFAVSYGRKWNRRMGEMLDPDEVTGIAGETVARHLPDYNPDLYPNCYTWLARKVQFACVDQVRRER